jgi:hypothetical protein
MVVKIYFRGGRGQDVTIPPFNPQPRIIQFEGKRFLWAAFKTYVETK